MWTNGYERTSILFFCCFCSSLHFLSISFSVRIRNFICILVKNFSVEMNDRVFGAQIKWKFVQNTIYHQNQSRLNLFIWVFIIFSRDIPFDNEKIIIMTEYSFDWLWQILKSKNATIVWCTLILLKPDRFSFFFLINVRACLWISTILLNWKRSTFENKRKNRQNANTKRDKVILKWKIVVERVNKRQPEHIIPRKKNWRRKKKPKNCCTSTKRKINENKVNKSVVLEFRKETHANTDSQNAYISSWWSFNGYVSIHNRYHCNNSRSVLLFRHYLQHRKMHTQILTISLPICVTYVFLIFSFFSFCHSLSRRFASKHCDFHHDRSVVCAESFSWNFALFTKKTKKKKQSNEVKEKLRGFLHPKKKSTNKKCLY